MATTTTYFCFFFLLLLCNSFEASSHNLDHSKGQGRFPWWVKPGDKKLFRENWVDISNVTVAADGTGNFLRIMDAVLSAPSNSITRFVIHVKRGVYFERVRIGPEKENLMIVGDGMDATIITGNTSHADTSETSKTATFGVKGAGFIARGISFENTAGPKSEQAVAFISDSKFSVLYQCGIFGYQDSLCANTNQQFYKECKISGTVDFIFGYAAAVFQNCEILVKRGIPGQQNTITAHGGKSYSSTYGFSFQFCNIVADSDLLPYVNTTQTYLGRPWHAYSTVIFIHTYMSDVLSPQGWLEWNGTQYLDTLYYAEYKNHGPGARLQNRVKWANYHILKDPSQAENFTVSRFISGDSWLPSTGVPFIPGLEN